MSSVGDRSIKFNLSGVCWRLESRVFNNGEISPVLCDVCYWDFCRGLCGQPNTVSPKSLFILVE